MKKLLSVIYIMSTMILLSSCNHVVNKKPIATSTQQDKRQLVIDVDKELEQKASQSELRGDDSLPLEVPMYIGDNDEVVIKGNFLMEKAPISIKIGDNDEVSFKEDNYVIPTAQLNSGEIIQLKDKNQKIFLELEVIL